MPAAATFKFKGPLWEATLDSVAQFDLTAK